MNGFKSVGKGVYIKKNEIKLKVLEILNAMEK